MVVRSKKRNRKYLGTRRWGLGNIKNGRGAGDRGGVGKGGRKHKWTLITAKFPETIKKKGFTRWGSSGHGNEITLEAISRMLQSSKSSSIELPEYKVLSNGSIPEKITVRAAAFSKKAAEKIQKAGGEATVMATEKAAKGAAQ